MTEDQTGALLDMTVGIVANYVSHNRLSPDEVRGLVLSTHAALAQAGKAADEPAEAVAKASAAQIRKSVGDQGLVSFVDGRTYQSLKRHIGTHGYTPETYREAFGLRADYPMVSPAYAAKRSALAKAAGLGQGGRKPKGPAKNQVGRPRKVKA